MYTHTQRRDFTVKPLWLYISGLKVLKTPAVPTKLKTKNPTMDPCHHLTTHVFPKPFQLNLSRGNSCKKTNIHCFNSALGNLEIQPWYFSPILKIWRDKCGTLGTVKKTGKRTIPLLNFMGFYQSAVKFICMIYRFLVTTLYTVELKQC